MKEKREMAKFYETKKEMRKRKTFKIIQKEENKK